MSVLQWFPSIIHTCERPRGCVTPSRFMGQTGKSTCGLLHLLQHQEDKREAQLQLFCFRYKSEDHNMKRLLIYIQA